jgi:hypothetical protein
MLNPNTHFLVMLNDGETWTEIKGCFVLRVSDKGLTAIQNGEDWDRLIDDTESHVGKHEGIELLDAFELTDANDLSRLQVCLKSMQSS